ncbi:uncharacterized protein LOC100497061 [Xenopus tropicalis]|uniref:Uncharacterized protein LOC100497061 n=1 Tax=Xenopus tropicalis TaxID=8364 RepID=A0A8J1JLK3_XENTR|nr:uncharacterized protein LOC100497061 [Xenopus tropicalis]
MNLIDDSETEHKFNKDQEMVSEKSLVKKFASLDEAMYAINVFEESSKTNFIVIEKKNFGNKDFWPCIPITEFTGVPHVIVGGKVFNCHLGKDMSLTKKRKYVEQRDKNQGEDHVFIKRRQCLQNTKKMDCPAKIFVYHLISFPGFQLEKDSTRNRKVTAQTLKNSFEQNIDKDKGIHSYMIKFPKLSDHKNHATSGELANIREKVDPRVNKIVELYRSGVRKASEIKRHTDTYVRHELFPGGDLPEDSRRRFYPTQKDISNLMSKDRYEGKNSVLDQQNVVDLVSNWQ